MVEIARIYESLPIPRSRLEKLGWTKAQLLGKQIDADNGQERFELAEQTSSKQLEKAMRGERAIKNAHCVLMDFTPKQYRVFEEALLANGGERSGSGILNKEQAVLRLIEHAAKGGSGHSAWHSATQRICPSHSKRKRVSLPLNRLRIVDVFQ